jgi:hypothetical protein
MEQRTLRYYIIEKEPGNLQIIKVLPADEANFLEDYGQYVLAQGSSAAEALQNYNPPQQE